ncbi:MAG: RraA family protein [Gammaproteobacteria bacterium]|nr:RraA family protein [Gammaproteobacteria bacterium]
MTHHELTQQLATLSPTHFCDASPHVRIFNPSLHRMSKPLQLIGRAITVEAEGDLLPVIHAIELATPGDVLVIASGGAQHALIGEILTTAAKKKGVAGVVLDGYCRDIDAIYALSMPFYAKGMYPAAGSKQQVGQLNVPIVCGDITVHPLDIIFGDDSGLIALSDSELTTLLPAVHKIKAREIENIEKIQQGVALSRIFGH